LPVITALGTAVLTFIFNMLDAIPFVPAEGLLAAVVLCLGLGATTLTHFGTKTYPRLSGSGNNDKMQIVFDTLPDDPANLK
jgi:hypothetical protein